MATDEERDRALRTLAAAVEPFALPDNDGPVKEPDSDASAIRSLLRPEPSRSERMFESLNERMEPLLERLRHRPDLYEHRARIAAAWEEVRRDLRPI
jgi:hypothetical protein